MSSYLQKLQELKEMVQFGPGVTFADLMKQFNEIGDQLINLWPWVPFDESGDIKCTIIPSPAGARYELILVHVATPSRFPAEPGSAFAIKDVSQHITGIDGTLIIERERYNDIVTPGTSKTVDPGEPCALNYGPGLYLFKQAPAIGKTEAFSFVNL